MVYVQHALHVVPTMALVFIIATPIEKHFVEVNVQVLLCCNCFVAFAPLANGIVETWLYTFQTSKAALV